ncbi:MAG: hypothetical protein JXA28_00640 [Bacteroidetes bacterium]|nr:hypothetical protein [Bacteroidota bacterium]
MALLISLAIVLLSLGAIVLTLGICRASRQADEMMRRIMDPQPRQKHAV